MLRNGLEYVPIVEKDFPKGTLATIYAELGECQGAAAMKYVVAWFSREAHAVMAEAPDAIRRAGIDLLLVDQTTPGPAVVAEHLGIPLVLVSNALLVNREAAIPPFFTTWAYSSNPIAQVRNRLAYAALDRLIQPYLDTLNAQRRRWNLIPLGIDGSGHYAARAHQPAAGLLRFSAPRDAGKLRVHRTVPRCPRAPALPVSLGAADRPAA